MNLSQALDFAPPTPACFPDREAWAGYLLTAQEAAERAHSAGRPFDAAMRYRPVYNFCTDCESGYAMRMRMARKCHPGQFLGIPIVHHPVRVPA